MPEYEIPMLYLLRKSQGPPPELQPRGSHQPNYEDISTFRSLPVQSNQYSRGFPDVVESSRTYQPSYASKPAEEKAQKVQCFGKTCCLAVVTGILCLCLLMYYIFMPSVSTSSSSSSPSKSKPPKKLDNTTHCSSGYTWFPQTNSCYKATVTPTSFPDSQASCQGDGANLTSIHSLSEGVFISGLYHLTYRKSDERKTQKTKYIYWVGMHQEDGEPWKWLDGSELEFQNFQTADFDVYENSTGERAAIGPTGVAWFITAQTVGGFVCKKPPLTGELPAVQKGLIEDLQFDNGKCPPKYYWIEATGACYRVAVENVSFDEATSSCESDKANLVSIHSNLENILLNGLIIMTLEDYNKSREKHEFWIGLRTEDGKFVWTDETPVEFFDWFQEENHNIHRRDMFAWTYWNSGKSTPAMERGFICKIQL